MQCKICGSAQFAQPILAREMMAGLGERFEYAQCLSCETLQIAAVPDNLADYYAGGYYSHSANYRLKPVIRIFKRWRDEYAVFERGIAGRLIYRFFPPTDLTILRAIPSLNRHTRILDVGCGLHARMMRGLQNLGFQNLLGVDPFLPVPEAPLGPRSAIRRCGVENVSGLWDLVMLNHSFEHMPEPHGTMAHLKRLLAPAGTLMIRVPTVSSEAWETYGADWCQLDAPRHLYLYSRRAMGILAERHDLVLSGIIDDSTAFQFSGSESIQRGIPLCRSYRFDSATVGKWTGKAKELNRVGRGDQFAAFFGHRSV